MTGELAHNDVKDIKQNTVESYRDIKPEKEMTSKELNDAVRDEFGKEAKSIDIKDESDNSERDNDLGKNRNEIDKEINKEIKNAIGDYISDIKQKSDYPDTVLVEKKDFSDIRKLSPEETKKKHEEFVNMKDDLKKQWEQKNGMEWPKYKTDVVLPNGTLIRLAGSDYDAHHIKPIGLGGENEVKNITPMHALDHFDKQGVHAPGSPYDKLVKTVGG